MTQHTIYSKDKLLTLLAEGAMVITPNNRLSNSLLEDYFKSSHKLSQQMAVAKPLCLPYNTACKNAWQANIATNTIKTPPLLITPFQYRHLWRTIVQSHPEVTYSESLLQSLIDAWIHCQQWQINSINKCFHHTPQTKQFQKWWQAIEYQLKELHVLTESHIVPYLIQSPKRLFPSTVVWACFDVFTPEQSLLQQHFHDTDILQYYYDLNAKPTQCLRYAARDTEDEYQQLSSWLIECLQKKSSKIGIVVPELNQESKKLQRILHKVIDSNLINLSLGQSLADFPIIAHALYLLSLQNTELTHHQASLMLQSPYIGYATDEFLARSQYLQDSTLLHQHQIPYDAFVHSLKIHAPKLASQLSQLKPYPKNASPKEWVVHFEARLHTMGFPGDINLSSQQYQCLNRFKALFDELQQLQVLTQQLSADDALLSIQQLAKHTIFQPQKTNAPIQILGLLEASGCEFDKLWVTGLTNHCLPHKIRLSPFIPPKLQQEYLMPHSTPKRELQLAQQTIQRLKNSSNTVIFSYPKMQGDSHNLPCSLIQSLQDYEPETEGVICYQSSHIIHEEESYLIPRNASEAFSGGTAVLANQAKCPFKAFAAHRLKAKPTQTTADGIDVFLRGKILHKIMELIWHQLGSQERLLKLDVPTLEQYMDEAITEALKVLKYTISKPLQTIEHTRLKKLLLAALQWEKQRSAFTVVAIEHAYTIELAGITFEVRVDRLDQVADSKWIIDYKSTLPTSKPWHEDRPKEPQLLLYALLDEHINTLILMQLKSGTVVCSGYSEVVQDIKGVAALKKEDSWVNCRNRWKEALMLLATEFQEGHCLPHPAQLNICQQCDFQNLCRFSAD
jgi:ATP-dependent helicase/nuclease subunit B